MTQSTWDSLTPVLKEMLENDTLDDAAKNSLRTLLQKEGYSVHLRDAAGRSDWLQQQANHLATHVRLAEVHADVMKDERNAAAAGCQELHAAGVAVTARAQTELQSAQLHYDELQARARTLNTDLATSEFRRKSADEDVRKLRSFLEASEQRFKVASGKFAAASQDRDSNAMKLATEEAQAHQLEQTAQRAVNSELVQHSHMKRLQDELTTAAS